MSEQSKILIVDDNPNDLLAYKECLKNENADIVTAESGENALRELMKNNYSLILMDVQLSGMSGFETVQRIKQRRKDKDIPVVFITGEFKQDEFKKYAFEIGCFDYIIKPVDSLTLQNKVRVFLNLTSQKKDLENKAAIEQANIALHKEIEQRKLLEQKLNNTLLLLKNSNTELEQFAYVASHDLQEPLRMVSSFVQLLSNKYKDKLDEKANELIEFAVEGAVRMQKMIQDLLEYSRIQTQGESFNKMNTTEVLKQAMHNLQKKIEETDAIIKYSELPVIKGDESQVTRLFQNLILNAIKFCPDKKPEICISSLQQNGGWQFSVKDNGIGIEKKYHDRIFQVFQRLNLRTEYEGTGIGLAICKRIAERHNGKIWFESEPGAGTTFFFTINNNGI